MKKFSEYDEVFNLLFKSTQENLKGTHMEQENTKQNT